MTFVKNFEKIAKKTKKNYKKALTNEKFGDNM